MRNTELSGKTALVIALSSWALRRSCPKGFSITTRRQESRADRPPGRSACSCWTTTGKNFGGTDR